LRAEPHLRQNEKMMAVHAILVLLNIGSNVYVFFAEDFVSFYVVAGIQFLIPMMMFGVMS